MKMGDTFDTFAGIDIKELILLSICKQNHRSIESIYSNNNVNNINNNSIKNYLSSPRGELSSIPSPASSKLPAPGGNIQNGPKQ